MVSENIKAQEIKRLTAPLTFKEDKAYDCEGNVIGCFETLSEVKFIVEPRPGILSDDEILQYAPQSKAASKIRLKMGSGNFNDILTVNEAMPALLGLYYVILISIAIPVNYGGNKLYMFILLVLVVLPLVYLYRAFNINSYIKREKPKKEKAPEVEVSKKETVVSEPTIQPKVVESHKNYAWEAEELKAIYDSKETIVKDLIAKRFEPPQITYDRFMSSIDSCHKLFYSQADAVVNITKLATDDTPRVRNELDNKMDAMIKIINQVEDLTNELVININSDEKSKEEVNILIDDMDNLIESVKEY